MTLTESAAGSAEVGWVGEITAPAIMTPNATGIPMAALPRPTGMSGLAHEWPAMTCHNAVPPTKRPTVASTPPMPPDATPMNANTTSIPRPTQTAGPNLRGFGDLGADGCWECCQGCWDTSIVLLFEGKHQHRRLSTSCT